jgi:hypothetical protein
MPNVRIQHPAGIFLSDQHKENYMEQVAVYAARFLDCNDDDGNPISLTEDPDAVDVTLVSYEPEDVRLHGTVFVVEVWGINYLDRMHLIGIKMAGLKSAILLHHLVAFNGEEGDISLMFIPVAKKCWV